MYRLLGLRDGKVRIEDNERSNADRRLAKNEVEQPLAEQDPCIHVVAAIVDEADIDGALNRRADRNLRDLSADHDDDGSGPTLVRPSLELEAEDRWSSAQTAEVQVDAGDERGWESRR